MKRFIFTILGISLCLTIIPILANAQSPLIKNNLQVKGIVKKNTKIYNDPSTSSYSRGVAEKFSIVFLFTQPGSSSAEKNGFYYVGKGPDGPTGWVPKGDLVEWNHRVCLNFSTLVGREPALIYGNQNAVQEVDWDTNKKPNSNAIAQEPEVKSKDRYDMLLPVLEEKYTLKKGSCQEYTKAYKIAYLGGTSEGGAATPVVEQKTRLDLMFLLDATGSMADEIEGAKKVVNAISNQLKNLKDAEVRFGVSAYRDYGDDFVQRQFLPLTSDYRQVANAIAGIKADKGGDTQEAMFDGVKAAITSTRWSAGEDRPALRVVILIGDASAHPFGDASNPEGLEQHDLVTLASKHRVRFITIKLMTNTDDDNLHKVQLRDFVTGLEDADKGLYLEVEMSTDMTNDYIKKLTTGIESEVRRMMELESVRRGVMTLEDVTPTDRAIFLKNLPKSGFPSKGSFFNVGWITEKNAKCKPQVEQHVFMTWDDLNLYIFYLQAAISTAQSSDSKITKVMEDKISALSGEKYSDEMNLGKHLEKRLSLPSSGGGILNFTIGEIAAWSESRKKHMIESMRDKKKTIEDFMSYPENFRRPSGTSFQYTFMPMRYMP